MRIKIAALMVSTIGSLLWANPTGPLKNDPKPTAEAVPPKVAAARALVARWNAAEFISFAQFEPDYSRLLLPELASAEKTVEVSEAVRAALQVEARRFLQALRAPSFREFMSAVESTRPVQPSLAADAVAAMRASLKLAQMHENPASLSGAEVLENFWVLKTKLGQGKTYFSGLAPAESYYTLRRLRTLGEVKGPGRWLQMHVENVGVVEALSCFSYGLSPTEAFARDGGLVVADLRLLVRCERDGKFHKAYPIVVRYFLDARRQLWIPSHIFQLYAAAGRDIRPIF